MSIITRPILILSLVSFFTDISSEMLYPVLPLYLKTIGFSIGLIGLLEGLAEAASGLSKGYFGRLSDLKGRRLPFVQAGYLMSALSKPLMALSTLPACVFGARTLDRLGKGVRTGARDALLSAETTAEHKGKVFGFHRALDTAGAALGPLLALLILHAYPGSYRLLFVIAFAPGIAGAALTFLVKETRGPGKPSGPGVFFFKYVGEGTPGYRRLLAGLLLFALFNSSDMFLLLMVKHRGFSDAQVVGVYVFYNLIYALFSYPVGKMGDKLGLKTTFGWGLLLFSGVYAGMAFNPSRAGFFALFFLYGIYAASTEGISKAWISNLCGAADAATALGTYAGLSSVFTLLSSLLTGLVWQFAGPTAALLTCAAGASAALLFILLMTREPAPGS